MKTFVFIFVFILGYFTASSQKIDNRVIYIDSLECCRTIYGKTRRGEIKNVPIIYTTQLHVDSIDGYLKFDVGIPISIDGVNWPTDNELTTFTITSDNTEWIDGSWDTIISETTPFTAEYIGIRIKTYDSTQVSRHKHSMKITKINE